MSHQRVKFFTKNRVGCVQCSPKNLFDFQMMVKKKLLEQSSTPIEIGMIQAVRGIEEPTDKVICEDIDRQILEIVNNVTKEYEEVIINPQLPNRGNHIEGMRSSRRSEGRLHRGMLLLLLG